MIVTPLGSGCFAVEASPGLERHTVDVRAYAWNGECTCPKFHGYCLFMLLHQSDRSRRQRCEHILAARDWIVENEYPPLVDQAEKIIELELPATTNESRLADTDTGL